MVGPSRERRLITRFFRSSCPGFDKLADLFFSFFIWMVGPSREKAHNNSIFFGSACLGCDKLADFFPGGEDERFESRKASHYSIFSAILSVVLQISRFIFSFRLVRVEKSVS